MSSKLNNVYSLNEYKIQGTLFTPTEIESMKCSKSKNIQETRKDQSKRYR